MRVSCFSYLSPRYFAYSPATASDFSAFFFNYAIIAEAGQFFHHSASVNGKIIRQVRTGEGEPEAVRSVQTDLIMKKRKKLISYRFLLQNMAVLLGG